MKKSRLGKMMILVLTVMTVFAFATTAFATYDEYMYKHKVTGGKSQQQADFNYWRSESNSMDVDVSWLDLNGQSQWKFRGYYGDTNTATTVAKQMYSTQYYCAAYTTGTYAYMNMKMSIESSAEADWLKYSGYLYF